jgi:hypothetical protein
VQSAEIGKAFLRQPPFDPQLANVRRKYGSVTASNPLPHGEGQTAEMKTMRLQTISSAATTPELPITAHAAVLSRPMRHVYRRHTGNGYAVFTNSPVLGWI